MYVYVYVYVYEHAGQHDTGHENDTPAAFCSNDLCWRQLEPSFQLLLFEHLRSGINKDISRNCIGCATI